MAQIKSVPEATPDPKAGNPRQKSGVAFPYYNLAQSIDVAKVMYQNGGSCDRAQLATLLNYKGINNGSFLTRVTAAKMFGLIEQEGNQLRVTERGLKIVAPVNTNDADGAKLDAFMGVELFRKVFDEYNGRPLPPEVGLRNLLEQTYSVVKDRVTPTVKIMMDSADEAGLFRIPGNRSKMVLPISGSTSAPLADKTAIRPVEPNGDARRGSGSGGGGGNGTLPPNIDPAFIALLSRLPEAGTELSKTKRENLIAAFTAAVNWIYPAPDTD